MDPKACQKCGTPTDAEYAGGLCPACLLTDGLQAVPRLRCHACHDTLADDVRFCGHCGAPVPAEPAAQGDSVRAALEAKLQSQYRIVRLLGRGGMGSVYLARDLTLDREVAIKVVKTDTSAREFQDRLRREARTAARLSHPNVVPLYSFGDVEGMPYFVMGYVRGESLAARLRRDGKLREDAARRILADLADALDHAHRQGVVHRDVKPDNVLLDDESGRALLTDFGVAKALGGGETMTSAGSVVGTPSYMSPEQAAGRADIDGRSDIYSLGVMGYAMLAGRLPFEGKTAGDILSKHLTQEPPPLRALAPELSDSTVHAVERCMGKDPARRWPDARSLRRALGAVEEGALPDALRAVEGKGITGATFVFGSVLFLSWVFYFVQGARGDIFGNAFFGREGPGHAVFPAAIALGYVLLLTSLRRQGFSFRQSQAAIWTEPSWWPAWYPRALRRPGNAWERLPVSVRVFRSFVAVSGAFIAAHTVVVLLVSIYLRQYDLDERDIPNFDPLVQAELVLVIGLLALGLVLRMWAVREMTRKGLGKADADRVVIAVPPGRATFWARPHIAAVLAPAPHGEAEQRADSPHDQLQSVLRNADGLSGSLRTLGAQASVAARQLLVSIEHADREIAELARSLDPGEEERLAARIAALGGASAASAEVRPLLEKQLALVRELSSRIEEGRAERSRRLEMLKTLALHLASLRARAAEAPAEVPPLSERVRQLCDQIGGQALALAEARAAAGRASTEAPTQARPS